MPTDDLPQSIGAEHDETKGIAPATLRLWNAFACLDPAARRRALAIGEVREGLPGQPLRYCDHMTVVVSGCVSVTPHDTAIAAWIAGPGDMLTLGSEREVVGRWICKGEVYVAPPSEWLSSAGTLGLRYAISSADLARGRLERQVACGLTHPAAARLADFLLAVREATRAPIIALSQSQMAEMLGLTRSTANEICRQLERAGAIRTLRGKVKILDESQLASFACGCRKYSQIGQFVGPQQT